MTPPPPAPEIADGPPSPGLGSLGVTLLATVSLGAIAGGLDRLTADSWVAVATTGVVGALFVAVPVTALLFGRLGLRLYAIAAGGALALALVALSPAGVVRVGEPGELALNLLAGCSAAGIAGTGLLIARAAR